MNKCIPRSFRSVVKIIAAELTLESTTLKQRHVQLSAERKTNSYRFWYSVLDVLECIFVSFVPLVKFKNLFEIKYCFY